MGLIELPLHLLRALAEFPWHLLIHHLGLIAALGWITTLVTSTANTAKTRAVEQRATRLEGRAGVLEQGTFNNVSGGSTVTMTTGQGNVTVRADALAQFGSANQTEFLATLQVMSAEGDQALGSDGFGGGVWTASQATSLSTLQGLLNATTGGLNNLIARLQSGNYMN